MGEMHTKGEHDGKGCACTHTRRRETRQKCHAAKTIPIDNKEKKDDGSTKDIGDAQQKLNREYLKTDTAKKSVRKQICTFRLLIGTVIIRFCFFFFSSSFFSLQELFFL